MEEKFCFLKSFYEGAKRYKNMKPFNSQALWKYRAYTVCILSLITLMDLHVMSQFQTPSLVQSILKFSPVSEGWRWLRHAWKNGWIVPTPRKRQWEKSSTVWGYNPSCGQCVESFIFPDRMIFLENEQGEGIFPGLASWLFLYAY